MEIYFSLTYEYMMYKFYRRLDILVCLILIALAVIGITFQTLTWVAIAIQITLVIFHWNYKAGIRSVKAKAQYHRYMGLWLDVKEKGIGAKESKERFIDLQATDSDPIGILYHPARLSSLAQWGIDNTNSKPAERKFTIGEKLALLFISTKVEFKFK